MVNRPGEPNSGLQAVIQTLDRLVHSMGRGVAAAAPRVVRRSPSEAMTQAEISAILGPDFDRELISAVKEWAARAPDAHSPLLAVMGGSPPHVVSAHDFAEHLERGTPFGREQLSELRSFAVETPQLGGEGVIRMFRMAGSGIATASTETGQHPTDAARYETAT